MSDYDMEQFIANEVKSYMKDYHRTAVSFPEPLDDLVDDMSVLGQYFNKFELLANGGIIILDERSQMKKAIKITKENIGRLTTEFSLDESELDQEFGLSVGMWLIADFGAKHPEAYLSAANFEETFDIATDVQLQNGYVAIVDKGTYVPLVSE